MEHRSELESEVAAMALPVALVASIVAILYLLLTVARITIQPGMASYLFVGWLLLPVVLLVACGVALSRRSLTIGLTLQLVLFWLFVFQFLSACAGLFFIGIFSLGF